MYDLSNYITAANHSTEKWISKNYPMVYNDILSYTRDILNLDFKQKLWHYKNHVQHNVQCANTDCNNLVRFKGRWTVGYYKYCCQLCSVNDVEDKKALLNYSRKSKLTKEEKEINSDNKQQLKINRKERILKNKTNMEDKKLYYDTISVEEYKKISVIKSGIYTREEYVKHHMNHIYLLINEYSKNYSDILFEERAYMFLNSIIKKPTCPNCGSDTQFKNKTIGYAHYCSVSCSSIHTSDKALHTFFNKNGVTHQSLLPQNIEKRLNIRIEKIKSHIGSAQFLEYKDDVLKTQCDKCDKTHEIHYDVYSQRVQLDLDWRCCITGYMNGTSNGEQELKDYIKSIYDKLLVYNDRKILNGKEVDIYVPELNLAFEYNGLYWHSELHKDKNYHHDKWLKLKDKDIQLIQIYEDEWIFKQKIVKSRINSLFNISKKIYARKCVIKNVSFSDTKQFLDTNHLQGSVNSSINLGLYYNDELVSIMTFGRPRKGLKYKSDKVVYELYRFCSKLNTVVIGGGSRLFKYFIDNHNEIEEVFSYSALEWSGTVYEKFGMRLENVSNFSYWYIVGKHRISRHQYNKQNLIKMGYDRNKSADDIMKELKIYKIYGAGNKRYVFNNQSLL